MLWESCSKVAVDLDGDKAREDFQKTNLKQGGFDASITVPGIGARTLTDASSRQKDGTVFINMLLGNLLTSLNSSFLDFFSFSS